METKKDSIYYISLILGGSLIVGVTISSIKSHRAKHPQPTKTEVVYIHHYKPKPVMNQGCFYDGGNIPGR
jgi:hypothetical protein